MLHSVLALGEEADFEALNCLPALNPLFFAKCLLAAGVLFVFIIVKDNFVNPLLYY
jgi:hypothetical protein